MILIPFFILIILLLIVFQGGNIFFTQLRTGYREKPFYIIKFKTMNDLRDESGQLLSEHQRLTGIGGFLRRSSIDELPQLLNILKGEMSMIGPRPLPISYLPLFNDLQRMRYSVLPGITGLTQVNGRHEIPWRRKLELDIHYVANISLLLDLKILAKTFLLILSFRKDSSLSEKPFEG